MRHEGFGRCDDVVRHFPMFYSCLLLCGGRCDEVGNLLAWMAPADSGTFSARDAAQVVEIHSGCLLIVARGSGWIIALLNWMGGRICSGVLFSVVRMLYAILFLLCLIGCCRLVISLLFTLVTTHINVSLLFLLAHGHRLSDASSTSSYDSASDEPSTSASPSPPPSVSGSPSLTTPPTPATSLPATPAISQSTEKPQDVPERVTLTSTFTPRELLCIDRETGETRFVEPRVPDGISLRNFGIQVVSVLPCFYFSCWTLRIVIVCRDYGRSVAIGSEPSMLRFDSTIPSIVISAVPVPGCWLIRASWRC
jgi:hypothetical protein